MKEAREGDKSPLRNDVLFTPPFGMLQELRFGSHAHLATAHAHELLSFSKCLYVNKYDYIRWSYRCACRLQFHPSLSLCLRHFFSCLLSSASLLLRVEHARGCLNAACVSGYSERAFRTSPYTASWVAWRAYPV